MVNPDIKNVIGFFGTLLSVSRICRRCGKCDPKNFSGMVGKV